MPRKTKELTTKELKAFRDRPAQVKVQRTENGRIENKGIMEGRTSLADLKRKENLNFDPEFTFTPVKVK